MMCRCCGKTCPNNMDAWSKHERACEGIALAAMMLERTMLSWAGSETIPDGAIAAMRAQFEDCLARLKVGGR